MAAVKDNLLSALCSSECSSLLILQSSISSTNLPSAQVHDLYYLNWPVVSQARPNQPQRGSLSVSRSQAGAAKVQWRSQDGAHAPATENCMCPTTPAPIVWLSIANRAANTVMIVKALRIEDISIVICSILRSMHVASPIMTALKSWTHKY